ncbi:terminase family protein [Larkinella soli]|uniref:terminase family protein n=1 Tax=Larkinella soli TaxID=1770527 RepID=UPI000FFB77C0|nr:terminase family protein [Larkinella soli]
MNLTQKQTRAIDLLESEAITELLYGGAAGGGKSALGCFWLIFNCYEYPGSRWLMGRAVLKTLKETTLKTFFEIAAREGLVADVDYQYRENAGVIRFSGGSEILLKDLFAYPSDPNFDSLGSLEVTGAFIDEANQITEKAKNIVKSRIRYKLDEFGLKPKLLMTCNPAKGWAYESFYRPFKAQQMPHDRAFVPSLVTDNPHISRHYINNLHTLDKASKERLLYGNWEYDSDPAALIEYDAILDLWKNDFVAEGEKYITCDAARFGGDAAKIAVWSGWRIIGWHSLPKCSMTHLADQIEALMTKHNVPASHVIVDEDGVGGGVFDIFRDYKRKAIKGFLNGSSPLEEATPQGRVKPNYANLKAQCYYRLADRINHGGVYIACPMPTEEKERLIQDLEQVKQKDMDKDGKRAVVPKEKVKELIGRSPDGGDTLMFREWFELKPKKELVFR